MFENIKLIGKAAKAGYKMGKSGGIENYVLNKIERNDFEEKLNDNIYVMTDDIIIGCGIRFGAAVICQKQDGTTIFAIIKEKYSDKLGIDEFLMNHELGHIENEFKMGMTSIVRNLMSEYAADEYAAKQIGLDKAIESLKVLASQKGVDKNELQLRVKHLEFKKEMINNYKSIVPQYKNDLKEAELNLEEAKNHDFVIQDMKNDHIKFYSYCINDLNKQIEKMENEIKMYGC